MALESVEASDTARSRAFEYIDDLLKIRSLNNRATAEWTRQNNGERGTGGANWEASERKQERCWTHAQNIAKARGWKIATPGLWWIVRDAKGMDITPRE